MSARRRKVLTSHIKPHTDFYLCCCNTLLQQCYREGAVPDHVSSFFTLDSTAPRTPKTVHFRGSPFHPQPWHVHNPQATFLWLLCLCDTDGLWGLGSDSQACLDAASVAEHSVSGIGSAQCLCSSQKSDIAAPGEERYTFLDTLFCLSDCW